MDLVLQNRDIERLKDSYRPYYLAVDEFAIQKGHSYATCVMDLVRGEVIWVGRGRSIKDFSMFIEHFSKNDYLSEVKQVRLAEARKHKDAAKELAQVQASKDEIKKEKRLYSQVKRARWTLLSNRSNLKDEKVTSLNEILESHSDLALCYAMKEEMVERY